MHAFTPPALHGIIGYPLGHSLSPLLHNTAFKTLGLPGVYLSWPVEPGRRSAPEHPWLLDHHPPQNRHRAPA